MSKNNKSINQRLSRTEKNADSKAWYKEYMDSLDVGHVDTKYGFGEVSEYRRMKVNYDLFNNILDLKNFEHVCEPFGSEAGELPAKMVNRDIVSGKIKAMLGMEMKRPFSWKVIATNAEATTRKEQEEFGKIREFVVNSIVEPIRTKIEAKYQQEGKEKELGEEEMKKIQQQIAEETKANTPDEVNRYMEREYQDPAEVLSHQLLEYLTQKCDLKRKFNNAFKHGLISAKEVMYVGVLNGEPEVWNVNSMRFTSYGATDSDSIEDGEGGICEYKMTPSEVITYLGKELSKEEIDSIYSYWGGIRGVSNNQDFFENDERHQDYDDNSNITVMHGVWKSLRKLGFLTYIDEQEQEQVVIVGEEYKLDKEGGDIKLEWEWIPEVYETWKIKVGEPIYTKMQPVSGQFKDLDNLYYCKLPYYGVIYDNMNSEPTSLMDRLKVYQYYYNIVMYRLELLLASDKGKKILMNINAIPDSAGIDIEKWQYFMESTPYMWYDPNEEGTGYADANSVAKVMDLSLISDIQKYIEIAEYLRIQAGRSVGITEQVEGQIGPNDAVRNTQQALTQSSHILELYFEMHNHMKKNVMQALIETAKIAYSENSPEKLTYVLDDMSRKTINMDVAMLDNSTLGLFVSNSAKAEEAKDLIRQLTHAAMQNQTIELSDIIATVRQEGIVEAEETLKAAEKKRREFEMAKDKENNKARAEEAARLVEREKEKHEEQKEIVILKEEEKRKTVITQTSLMGMSFNPDADADKDGVNDFLEIAKHGVDADIKKSAQQLARDEFEHNKEMDRRKADQDDKKISNDAKKIAAAKKS
mgnify:CR=1 FL=1|tara:strand:- start:8070 stop:10502 length:2433 start_codon:yes stop_codon:yes gene_type:complete